MSKNQTSIVEIYTEYVHLCQTGWSREDAARQLQPRADELTQNERQELVQLIQEWENREAQNSSPKPARRRMPVGAEVYDPQPTPLMPTPPIPNRSAQTPSLDEISQPAARSVLRRLDKSTTSPSETQPRPPQYEICPNCGKRNLKGDAYCYSCGNALELRQSGTKALEDDQVDPRSRWGTAHFGQFSALLLMLRGVQQPIEVTPKNETILGRVDPDSSMRPDIDLSAYNAENLGVSRLHAVIRRDEFTITISDLNSKNYTYINGQRLHPNEIRVLRDGDEIRLGRLPLKIGFRHQVRRL